MPFIQTDVPINPGNSGGPLFNLKGEVVGINSLIFSRTGGYMGLAFAIPIDVAMNVVRQIQDKGRVTRGRIGVQIQEVTRETADAFGLPKAGGALVNSVEKGGPADKAGIEAGDIIVKADNRTVSTSSELPRIITQLKPGSKVTLQVWRKGAPKDVVVTVAELKEDDATPPVRRDAPGKEKAKPNRMGTRDQVGHHRRRHAWHGAGGYSPGRRDPRCDQQGFDDRSEKRRSTQCPDRQAGKGKFGDFPVAARRPAVLLDDQARQWRRRID